MAGTVSAKTVRAALGAARVLGVDAGALAEAHSVSAALTDVDARFPHSAWLGLWQDLSEQTGKESVGLEAAEFAFASVVIRMRMALGFRWCPSEVRFAAPAPASQAAARQFFGCSVRFDVETSAIVVDSSALALPMQRPDPGLRVILERHAEMLVGQLGTETDLLSRTRRDTT